MGTAAGGQAAGDPAGGAGKEVHIIPMSELLWKAIDETEGLDAVVELERTGYVAAQDQVTTYLSDRDWCPLADLLAERLARSTRPRASSS